jgi:hypothetical protein
MAISNVPAGHALQGRVRKVVFGGVVQLRRQNHSKKRHLHDSGLTFTPALKRTHPASSEFY